ncbi:MAG TPA: type II toxin-antitoxin system RelE/ParE family toxin [Verrucomicrobiae bacterium]|nr:type II toxin-antitoxin system RelE/ParE family toxin [Verrucomicrobiae bacterium]
MRVVQHPKATSELESSAVWYEERQVGLGNDFLEEYAIALQRVAMNPDFGTRVLGQHRKLNFQRFPYAVVYRQTEETIYVVAVMHLHRRPFYWRNR